MICYTEDATMVQCIIIGSKSIAIIFGKPLVRIICLVLLANGYINSQNYSKNLKEHVISYSI